SAPSRAGTGGPDRASAAGKEGAAMRITKEAIEKARRRHDLVEVIRSRGVELTRKGKNYVGLCPFHEDHKPSLVVNPVWRLWKCFGACGAKGAKSGGDVFAFVA